MIMIETLETSKISIEIFSSFLWLLGLKQACVLTDKNTYVVKVVTLGVISNPRYKNRNRSNLHMRR